MPTSSSNQELFTKPRPTQFDALHSIAIDVAVAKSNSCAAQTRSVVAPSCRATCFDALQLTYTAAQLVLKRAAQGSSTTASSSGPVHCTKCTSALCGMLQLSSSADQSRLAVLRRGAAWQPLAVTEAYMGLDPQVFNSEVRRRASEWRQAQEEDFRAKLSANIKERVQAETQAYLTRMGILDTKNPVLKNLKVGCFGSVQLACIWACLEVFKCSVTTCTTAAAAAAVTKQGNDGFQRANGIVWHKPKTKNHVHFLFSCMFVVVVVANNAG